MPSRILRDTYATSESVASMDPGAQDRLPRYFLLADDFGAFQVNEAVICGRIFPLRPDMNPQRVAADLSEFQRAGVLDVWTHEDGKRYAEFPNWFKHQREPRAGTKRKHPQRPAGIRSGPQESADSRTNPPSQAQSQSSIAVAVESAGAGGDEAPPCSPERALERLGGKHEVMAREHPRTADLMALLSFAPAWPKDRASRDAVEAAIGTQDLAAVARRVEASFVVTPKPWLGWHRDAIAGAPTTKRDVRLGMAQPSTGAWTEGERDLSAI